MLKPHLRDPVLHDAAVTAAGLSGHVDAAPYLVSTLRHASDRSFGIGLSALATYVSNEAAGRRSARAALSTIDEPTKRRLIDAVRGHEDIERQRSALMVVGVLGTPEAADAVISALGDDRLAQEAEQALGMLGPAAVLALARGARTGQPQERAACVAQLGQLAEESTRAIACQAIIDATEDGAPEVVRAALVALSKVGDEGTLGLAARWLAGDAAPPIRHAAAAALSASAARHPDAARALSRQLSPDSPSAAVAATVIGALSGPVFGSVADDIVFLSSAASNPNPVVRRAALDALSKFGSPGAVEAVSFALTDEVPEVQLAAIRSLGRMRDEHGRAPGVVHLLEVSGTLTDDARSVAAIEALGATGEASALDMLKRVVREGSAMRAVAAVEALGNIDTPERIDALIHALSHAEPEVVKAALRTIAGEERDPRAAAHLAASLDHDAWDVRRLAAELLGRRGDAQSKHLLRQRLIVEREPLVHAEIERSLADPVTSSVRRTLPPLGGGVGGGSPM
jgi:HEAT repeat protein